METGQAISVVLIPPPEIIRYCIQKNKPDFDSGAMPVALGENDFLPHITLFMGLADKNQIPHISTRLEQLGKKYLPLTLKPEKITGNWMFFQKTPELMHLQQSIAQEVEPLVDHTTFEDHYFKNPGDIITPDCFPWVENFYKSFSFEHFTPHITTWSSYEGPPAHHSFEAESLALCHLGKYNTCRNILWKNSL